MNRISEDVSRVRMYTGPAIMYLANTIVTTVTILLFMFNVNLNLTFLVFLPLPILSVLIYRVSSRIAKQSAKVQAELGNLTTQTQETFSAIRVIKAYAREKYFISQMEEKNETYKKTAFKLASIEAMFAPVMALMVGASVLITAWYGGKLVIEGSIEPGNITEFILYVFRLTWPFASLGWVTSLIQRASASQERINEFLLRKPTIFNTNNNNYTIHGKIAFNNVSFTFPENNVTALKNISFVLPKGKTLGITGDVGSGKSTLINLLTRQYDVTQGKIEVDDLDIKEHNLNVLRKSFGVVPQEVFLFSDTVSNNISFGAPKIVSHSIIKNAAQLAGVHENILGFPEQYQTVVGERGVTLSGGQKQRISIARAILSDPEIVLLDDCLSAVDVETEEYILANLKKEMQSRTSIIVSHRVSSIKHADIIMHLRNGEITEMGNHEELLKLNGNYAKLFDMQKN